MPSAAHIPLEVGGQAGSDANTLWVFIVCVVSSWGPTTTTPAVPVIFLAS